MTESSSNWQGHEQGKTVGQRHAGGKEIKETRHAMRDSGSDSGTEKEHKWKN